MSKYRRGHDRDELLADVAEMYYLEDLNQTEISRAIGMTRSAVSRMLTEARQKGIVEISVRRPLRFNSDLENRLKEQFNLLDVSVLDLPAETSYDVLRRRLGRVGAQSLASLLRPEMICGVAWGTTVSATIDALEIPNPIPIKVVQLVGVLGTSSHAFNAQALVETMAREAGGEGVYLYSPFIVENAATARSILSIPDVRDAIAIGRRSDVALLGIGTITDEDYSSLYQGGHMTRDTLEGLRAVGAVGDVSGHHFDIDGNTPDTAFHDHLVGIAVEDLLAIPVRLAVSGGLEKAPAILGALRGGYSNHLITDDSTAAAVLALHEATQSTSTD